MEGARPRVLVVDDDPMFTRSVIQEVGQMGFSVVGAHSGEAGLRILEEEQFDIALVDYGLPAMSGAEMLRRARVVSPRTECIAITGSGDLDIANSCIKAGAVDYFEKPMNPQRLSRVLHRTARDVRRRREGASRHADDMPELFGHSPAIEDVKAAIRTVARSSLSILVRGETGSGKELVARAIHHQSGCQGAFVAFNCASVPPATMELELFGSVPGGFTHAVLRDGLLASANGGTLFIDEIGDMPLTMQATLLRALENGEYRRIGEDVTRRHTARIVAATHRDLDELVKDGKFREDLLFRLMGELIELPPLRDRRSDIVPLAYRFIEEFNTEVPRPVEHVSSNAKALLTGAAWRGNVRELRHVIHRAVVYAKGGTLRSDHLPATLRAADAVPEATLAPIRLPPEAFDLHYTEFKEMVQNHYIRMYLEEHMERSGGVVKIASRNVGVARPNLSRLLKRHGLNRKDFCERSGGGEE